MQFKVKVILAILGFVILGAIAFFLLRKKSVPEDEPVLDLGEGAPAPAPDVEPEEPTPTTNPAKPLVPPQPEPLMKLGVRGKFASEGGRDINNRVDSLSFIPAGSAEIHIEHVDVWPNDRYNKNASIVFKYKNTKHKFTFVGNEGLRFRQASGYFGRKLGVGDASSAVLTGMGLPTNSYKIECLRTDGRNTWVFKTMDLSKGLIGIDIEDNADWGGLRGVYVIVKP